MTVRTNGSLFGALRAEFQSLWHQDSSGLMRAVINYNNSTHSEFLEGCLPMRPQFRRAACAIAACSVLATSADASCRRLSFIVNDYGKDGPTRDAKALLDKYISSWAGENKIKGYSTGKKDVTCDLFLDFGVFDEYTCKATAQVCWGGPSTGKALPAAAPVLNAPGLKKPKAPDKS